MVKIVWYDWVRLVWVLISIRLVLCFTRILQSRPEVASIGAGHGTQGKNCACPERPGLEDRTLEELQCPDVIASAVVRHAKLVQFAPQMLKVCPLAALVLGSHFLCPLAVQLLGSQFVSPW
jgi:hypothetical protein